MPIERSCRYNFKINSYTWNFTFLTVGTARKSWNKQKFRKKIRDVKNAKLLRKFIKKDKTSRIQDAYSAKKMFSRDFSRSKIEI